MSMNLWGEIPLEDTIQAPKSILEAQAQELTSQTNGLLEGVVVVESTRNKDTVALRLFIRAPALNNYLYDVGFFTYPIVEFYPCNIFDSAGFSFEGKVVQNESEFISELKDLLQSERIKRAVRGLLAQVRS